MVTIVDPAVSGADSRRAGNLAAARRLAVPVFALAALAAALGLFSGGGSGKGTMVNAWGNAVAMDGHGLYARESVSGAAQERGQDIVTLVVALPFLAAGFLLSRKGGTASRVFLAGMLGYFLYAYGLMAFGAFFNPLFLVYVAVFSCALFAFAFALLSVDADAFAASVGERFPRRSVMAIDLTVGIALSLMWLARAVPPSLDGSQPPGLDGYHTMFVQAGDLGLIVPVAFLSAFWLLRRDPRGYLVGTVLLVKGAAMGLAVGAMGVSMNLAGAGTDAPLPLIVFFFAVALSCMGVALAALRGASAGSGERGAR